MVAVSLALTRTLSSPLPLAFPDPVVPPPEARRLLCLDQVPDPAHLAPLRQILRAVPDATVVLAGARLGSPGSPADLQRLADGCDVIVSACPGDPAGPLAAVLAMWRGRPFVGPAGPITENIVVDGVTGILTGPAQRSLPLAVRDLLNSPFSVLALGWAGRSRAEALAERTDALALHQETDASPPAPRRAS